MEEQDSEGVDRPGPGRPVENRPGAEFEESLAAIRRECAFQNVPSRLIDIAARESAEFDAVRQGDPAGAVRLLAIDGLFTEALGTGVARDGMALQQFDEIERQIIASAPGGSPRDVRE